MLDLSYRDEIFIGSQIVRNIYSIYVRGLCRNVV